MKKCVIIFFAVLMITSCEKSEDEKASTMMANIQELYDTGHYHETLDSIVSLRTQFPKAISVRLQALKLWQNASLKLAENDVARTDSALRVTEAAIKKEKQLYKANKLRAKRDSLKARFEAMCGVVRMIHVRQKEL